MYLATNNAVFSTRCSHKVTPKTLRSMASQNRHNLKVVAALDRFVGRTERDREREEFLAGLRATIKKSEGIAQVRAQALYARMRFGVDEPRETPDADAALPPPRRKSAAPVEAPAETPAQVFKVGEVVSINGERRRILALDSNGRPSEVSDEVIR